MNLDPGDVGADTDVGGVSDVSVSSNGDSVAETSVSDDTTVVQVRDNSVSVEGLSLSLPLSIDEGEPRISDHTVVGQGGHHGGSDGGVGESGNLQAVTVGSTGDDTSSGLTSQDLSDGVRLRFGLGL